MSQCGFILVQAVPYHINLCCIQHSPDKKQLFYNTVLFSSSLFSSLPFCSPLPQTAGEWAQVLQLQRQFHQAQLSKWQQILQSSVTLLDQVCMCFYLFDSIKSSTCNLHLQGEPGSKKTHASHELHVLIMCWMLSLHYVIQLSSLPFQLSHTTPSPKLCLLPRWSSL